jgi:hypothetical protein
MASEAFKKLQRQVKPDNKQFVEKNLAICKQIRHLLAAHPMINSQKALATALGKEPSEISKWLSGLHNIGLENITKMEVVLGHDIIITDEQAKEKYCGASVGGYLIFGHTHSQHLVLLDTNAVKATLFENANKYKLTLNQGHYQDELELLEFEY